MSSNTKKLIILTAVILLLSFLMGRISDSFLPGIFSRNSSSGSGKTFPVSGSFSGIEISSKTDDVHFYNAGRQSAKVVWSGNSSMKLSVTAAGNTLKIREQYKMPWFLRVGINTGKSEIAVYLPEKTYKELDIKTDTGNVMIPAGFSFETVDIETDTGAVDFQGNVSRELNIRTDTGRITCAAVKPEKLSLESDTGSVHVTDVSASKDIKIDTDTGKIVLKRVTAGSVMEIESDTGSIELDHCDAGKIDIESDTGSVTGTLLTGKIFIVKSGTGSVDVPADSAGGECKIKTDTGKIMIRVGR